MHMGNDRLGMTIDVDWDVKLRTTAYSLARIITRTHARTQSLLRMKLMNGILSSISKTHYFYQLRLNNKFLG